jgi:hypothetical protein
MAAGKFKVKLMGGLAALGLAAAFLPGLPGLQNTALASGGGPGQFLSSTTSPTWQTNNTVWAITSSNGVVYVGGAFTSVRPPGDPQGTGEVAQAYLAAFNASTGALIPSFNPTFKLPSSCGSNSGSPCGVDALAVANNTLYIGGSFTYVDGAYRGYLAALNLTTGAVLSSWKPSANSRVATIAPNPGATDFYIGGNFTKLDSQPATMAGEVDASGTLQPWAPVLNGDVTTIAVAPDDSRVLVGGYFTTFNGVTQQAIGSTNPSSGASDEWDATIEPDTNPSDPATAYCYANVKDIVISGDTAYIASEGTGGGCFDGDWAATVSTGHLMWENPCLGATQSLAIVNGVLYKGSHAHDCAYEAGGFPQTNPELLHHLLAQSLADGTLGNWFPNTDNNILGPRVMATDGTQLFLGGGFTQVNGVPQEGFTRFEPLPDTTAPSRPATPTATSTQSGVVRVTFKAVSDNDDGTLNYAIYQSGITAPIATLTATSWPWALPVLHYNDTGLTPGKAYTYTVTASDGTNTSAKSPASAKVTVSGTNPSASYDHTVVADGPSFFWPLNDASTGTASDLSVNNFTGIYEPGASTGTTGPLAGDTTDTATALDGQTGLVTSQQSANNPQAFSIEGWFETTTNTGGKLIGFGNAQTGWSTNYDRQIYMMNDGQLVFGIWNNQTETIETPNVYNDGQWHYVVATFDPVLGMSLYVDGQQIGSTYQTNPPIVAQNYSGYWRVGGDNLNGWNLDPWGGQSQTTTATNTDSGTISEPNSYYFQGSMADVAVYPYTLTASQVVAHYAAANYAGLNG